MSSSKSSGTILREDQLVKLVFDYGYLDGSKASINPTKVCYFNCIGGQEATIRFVTAIPPSALIVTSKSTKSGWSISHAMSAYEAPKLTTRASLRLA